MIPRRSLAPWPSRSKLSPRTALRLHTLFGTVMLTYAWSVDVHAQAAPAAAPTADAIERPTPKTPIIVEYPAGAAGDAQVELDLWIDKAGQVTQAEVRRGDSPFAERARQAVLSWQFNPARRAGRPVAAHTRVVIEFSPPPAPAAGAPAVPADTAPSKSVTAQPAPAPVEPSPTATDASPPVEVEVHGVRTNAASVKFSREEVRELPGAFGDPFRAVEIMPGVTPTTSGHPYFYVRGAPPGNVGYFIDDIPLPVLYHAVNGPAVVHPALIDSVTLYPGAYPARYGRYSGAVVAGQLAPPEFELRGEASVRLYDAGGIIEVPFANGHGSVMAGGRYSYSGALVSHFSPDVTFGYWDYQGRVQYEAGKGRVSVLALGAHDLLALNKADGVTTLIDTTFHRADVRYDYQLDDKTAARVGFTYGRDGGLGPGDGIRLRADQYRLRTAFSREMSAATSLRFGADLELDEFGYSTRGAYDAGALDNFLTHHGNHRLGVGGAWVDLATRVTDNIVLLPGLRFDVYHGQAETKTSVEPRLTGRFRVSKRVVLTNSVGLARQPPARQVPTPGYRPRLEGPLQTGIQTGAGLELALPSDVMLSLNLFQTVLLNGADFDGIEGLAQHAHADAEDSRVQGNAAGGELVLSRSLTKRLGGMLSYTLSRARRRVGNVEGPSGFDRTHVVSGVVGYDLGRGWRAGLRGMFYSGIPVRVGIVSVARHPPRTPPFWRLDTRIEKRWRLSAATSVALVLEVLNATLNDEVVSSSCYAYGCREERIGPITLPSLGVEASF